MPETLFIHIHPKNPQERLIEQVADCLRDGGIIIYPTDTVYGIGCNIYNARAIERLCRLKGINPEKANLSFICADLSHLSDFTAPFDRNIYRLMNGVLPGPYTFILRANNEVPKLLKSKKKTVGIRIPDNPICKAIVEKLGHPIISTSLRIEDEISEYPTDPDEIFGLYAGQVDIVIEGGIGGTEPSTVVDCSTDNPEIIRQGKGKVDWE